MINGLAGRLPRYSGPRRSRPRAPDLVAHLGQRRGRELLQDQDLASSILHQEASSSEEPASGRASGRAGAGETGMAALEDLTVAPREIRCRGFALEEHEVRRGEALRGFLP